MKLLENYGLSLEVQAYMSENLVWQRYPKNAILFLKGQSCDCVYFLETGLARGFYETEKEETTTWFVQSGDFVYSSYNFLNHQPASESVQLLEASTVVSIPLTTLNHIYSTYPETKEIGNTIIQKYTQLYNDLVRSFRHQTTDQRLRSFMETQSTIFDRLQKQHIASYLGMCRETLSNALGSKYKK